MKNELESAAGRIWDVAVIGGGIAGLIAGITAIEGGAQAIVLDAHRPGGRATTTVRNGYSHNTGPHALYLGGQLRAFLTTRGLDPPGGVAATKGVRLLRDGALWPINFGAVDIARTKLLKPRSRARALSLFGRLPRMDTSRFVGMSWADWLGNEPEDLAGLLTMLGRTTSYVNAPATYDAAAALDQLKLGLGGVRYLDGGWQTIVDWLESTFISRGGTLVDHAEATSVGRADDVVVRHAGGEIHARTAIIAGLAPDAAERLTAGAVRGRDAIGGPVHASALDLALDRVHDGLVFGIDEPLYLSPHAPLAKLAPPGRGLVSLLRYTPVGTDDGETPASNRIQLRALAELAGISDDDVVDERYLHHVVVTNGFPTSAGGGRVGRPSVDALGVDDVLIAGDWVGPQGHLADASAASGQAAARLALAHVTKTARVRA